MDILSVGDIHGKTKHLYGLVERQDPDLCLQVGDLEPIRNEGDMNQIATPSKYRSMGQFKDLYDDERPFPAPTYFVAGNHEPWGYLDRHDPTLTSANGELLPNLFYVGRYGVVEHDGVTIAGLSGNYGQTTYETHSDERQAWCERNDYQARKASSHFRYDEVVSLLDQCEGRDVDVLLTHEWPDGLITRDEAETMADDAPDHITAERILDYGVEPVRTLLDSIKPEYHFCGHVHHRLHRTIGDTDVICLGHIKDGGDAWVSVTI